MAANRPSVYDNQFFNAGVPAAGFKLYTYASGTTTPKATYTDQAGTIPNTNPITLDAQGMCELWLGTGEYTLALYTGLIGSGGALVNTWDDVEGAAGAGDITTLRADLANASDPSKGAGMIGFKPDPGSAARTVQDKLRDQVSIKDFGAVGDGVTDDTLAIQNAIDASTTGSVIDGLGKTYVVTSLKPKSFCTLENFNLITKAGSGPSADFVSPITINYGQTGALFTDITIRNVHIDGNRVNQLAIDYPTPAGEDGGRHGFRVLGHVENLLIEDCSATYCGTDGIEFLTIAAYTAVPSFKNIRVVRTKFNWNRRHGGSHPCADNIKFIDCEFNDNGQNLGAYPVQDGGHGASVAGTLYGNGYDMEQSGAGGQSSNAYWDNCQMLRNAESGFLAYDPSIQTDPAFVANLNINITNCKISKGTVGATNYAIIFTSSIAQTAGGAVFKQVNLLNNNVTGRILLRALDTVNLNDGFISSTGADIGQLDYATNVVVGVTQTAGQVFAATASTVIYSAAPIQGTWTPTITAFTGALTSVTGASGSYTKVGNLVFLNGQFTITDNGTGATLLKASGLPFVGSLTPTYIAGSGINHSDATALAVEYVRGSATVDLYKYDATYPGITGKSYSFSVVYSV